jgi:phospholipid-binding lipoprotein MlaA
MNPPILSKRPIPLVLLAFWALVGLGGCAPAAVRPRPVEAPAPSVPATAAAAAPVAGPPASAPSDPTELSTTTAGPVPPPPAGIAAAEGPADVAKGRPSAQPDAGREQEAPRETASAAGDGFDIDLEEQPAGFPDPFERLNRRMFAFNRRLDAWVIAPVSRTYGFVVPRPAKAGVRNFLFNLASPVRLVNDVLQGQWSNAGNTAARFAINTVAGVGGIVDTAKAVGLPPHDADFGQTLAKKGVGSGPFLVVPVLGPTTVRDGFGAIVDTAMNPATYLATPVVSSTLLSAGIGASASGLVEREHHDRDLRRLEEGSTDYYAALRSAYYQNRIAQIESPVGGSPGASAPATPSASPSAPVEPRAEPTPGS